MSRADETLTFDPGRRLAVEQMTTYTIGRVAERTGFSASALWFYEGHGLLDPVDRSAAGYRLYDESS